MPRTGEPVAGTSRSTLFHVKHDGFTILPHESGLRDFNSALNDVYPLVAQQVGGFGVNGWDTKSERSNRYGDRNHHMSTGTNAES